jgi:hypothetical protein
MTSNLISKNIDNYFNELINKQVVPIPKKSTSFNIFYKNYIEHNLLLIFIIILIGIFLLFKYYLKENTNDDNYYDYKKNKNYKDDDLKKKNKIKKKRELLAKEKNEILSIIDELSELNFEKSKTISKNYNIDNDKDNSTNNNYIDNNTNNNIDNNYIDNNIETTLNVDAYKNNNLRSEDYYNINDKNSELINGIYFETPYN